MFFFVAILCVENGVRKKNKLHVTINLLMIRKNMCCFFFLHTKIPTVQTIMQQLIFDA